MTVTRLRAPGVSAFLGHLFGFPSTGVTIFGTMRWIIFLVGALVAASCSGEPGSPTSPTPVPPPPITTQPPVMNVAGAWTGTLRMTFKGTRFPVSTMTTLQQTERVVTGTWQITSPGNDTTGSISLQIEGFGKETTFSGTATWNTASADPNTRCIGQSSYTGFSANGSVMNLDSPIVEWGATCGDAPVQLAWEMVK